MHEKEKSKFLNHIISKNYTVETQNFGQNSTLTIESFKMLILRKVLFSISYINKI
jgi:hypothetical protein